MEDSDKMEGTAAEQTTAEAKVDDMIGRFERLWKAFKERHWKAVVIALVGIIGLAAGYFPAMHFYATYAMNSALGEALKGVSVVLLPSRPDQVPDYKQQAVMAVVAQHRQEIAAGKDVNPQYLLQLGNVEFSLGHKSDALRYYEKGLRQARKKKDESSEAAALLNMAVLQLDDRELTDKAADAAYKALEIHQRKGMTEEQANDLATVGQIWLIKRDFGRAILAFEQARNLYENEGKVDKVGDMMLDLGRVYKEMRETTKALDFLKKANQHHTDAGDQRGRAEDLAEMGIVHSRIGDKKSALRDLQEARKIFSEGSSRGEEARTLSDMGRIFHEMGEHDQALKSLKQSVELSKRKAERRKEADNLFYIGLIYTDKGSPDLGLEYMQQALNSSKEIKDAEIEARALHHMGMAYKKKGEYDRALEFLEDARLVHNRVNNKIGEAADLAEIGFLHRDKGRLRESQRELEKSLKLFREERDRQGEALVLGYLGVVYLDQRQIFKSRRVAWDSYRIHVERKYFKGKAEQLVRLALIDREEGALEKALGRIDEAERVYNVNPSDELGRAHMNACRGLLHKDKEDFREALRYFTEAHEVFQRETGDLKEEATVNSEIALARHKLGETRNRPALVSLQAALDLHSRIGFKQGQAVTLGHISQVYLDWKNLPDALTASKKALRAHEQSHNNKGEAEMHARIGFIELKTGKHGHAERSLERAQEICQNIGDSRGKASALLLRGMAKYSSGDADGALEFWKQGGELARQIDCERTQVLALGCKAFAFSRKGKSSDALTVLRDAKEIGKGLAYRTAAMDLGTSKWAAPATHGQEGPDRDFCKAARGLLERLRTGHDSVRYLADMLDNEVCKEKGSADSSRKTQHQSIGFPRFDTEPVQEAAVPVYGKDY
jgi:tetratricopeptide (TPR) repeat protein